MDMKVKPESGASRQGELRVATLRKRMAEQKIDALVCMKPENTFYLSGFNPIMYSHPVIAILPLDGPLTLLVHALRDDHARASAWVADIKLYGAWSTKVFSTKAHSSWLNCDPLRVRRRLAMAYWCAFSWR